MQDYNLCIDSIQYTTTEDNNDFFGYSIDTPKANDKTDTQAVYLTGWLIGKKKDVSFIQIYADGQLVKETPLNIYRGDVDLFYGLTKKKPCGFSISIGLFGLPSNFELLLKAVVKNNCLDKASIAIPFASIKGRRIHAMNISYIPKRQPLMLTSIPRSGTTWVMEILSSISNVISQVGYPNEVRIASYWIHAMKIMSDPSDFVNSTTPDYFDSNMSAIGHNPYYDPCYFSSFPQTKKLHSEKILDNMAECCMKNIDTFYDAIEDELEKHKTVFFLEKHWPNHIQNIYREMYKNPKEIILIRDLRDVVCSMIFFNHKRGTQEFGRDLFLTDHEWIISMRNELIERLLISLRRRNRNVLLLRYEDLVLNLPLAIKSILSHLDVKHSDEIIREIIHTVNTPTNERMIAHQTSLDSMDSIGRWKRVLDNDLIFFCNEVLKDALIELGYEI